MDSTHNPDSAPRTRAYHHGNIRTALLDSARQILEEGSPSELSLRAVARRAGVSHAAPYRHFPNHEALLVELAMEGFEELKSDIVTAGGVPGGGADKSAHITARSMR